MTRDLLHTLQDAVNRAKAHQAVIEAWGVTAAEQAYALRRLSAIRDTVSQVPQHPLPGTGHTQEAATPTPRTAPPRPMGLSQTATRPLREAPSLPVLPQSPTFTERKDPSMPEPSEVPTPEEMRGEWLRLVTRLEGFCLEFREHSRSSVALLDALAADACLGTASDARPMHRARAWAADRLLDQLLALPAPVVPVDDERGQGTILTLVPEEPS